MIDGTAQEPDADVTLTIAAMKRSIDRIRALGKRVVVVAPPPSTGIFDIGECLERKATGLLRLGTSNPRCQISIPL